MVIWLVARLVGNKAIMASRQNAAMPIANVTSTRENPGGRGIVNFMADISAPSLSCSRFAQRLRSDSKKPWCHGFVATLAPYRRQFDLYCLYIESERHLPGRN